MSSLDISDLPVLCDSEAIFGAEDPCSFIRQYCSEENGGVNEFHDFYFCTLGGHNILFFIFAVTHTNSSLTL